MSSALFESQIQVCKAAGVKPHSINLQDKIGISRSAIDNQLPLNGMRHSLEQGLTGWFIYGGEEFSTDEGFFKPLHVSHLATQCPLALRFLLLPPGWRFLTDGEYEDVWFDQNLLLDN